MPKLNQVMNEILEDIDTFTQEFSKDSFAEVVNRTPVATGYAKGNWNLSIGAPDFTERNEDPSGNSTISRAQSVAQNIEGGNVIYISNGVDYVFWLEQGTSDQAPQGMANPASAKAQPIADEVARRLR